MSRNYRRPSRKGWTGTAITIIVLILSIAQQQGWLDHVSKTAQQTQPGLYKIHTFTDGDTISVIMNGSVEKIRFIGVDTPETHKPNTPVQCYGPAAAAYTKTIIGTKSVRLVSDSQTTDRDRYGRLLRYVFLPDGRMVNKLLIENGYGFYYPYFPFTQSTEFAAAQATAQANNKGLWRNCSPSQTDKGGYVSNNQ
jgi:micrococcal nuclease